MRVASSGFVDAALPQFRKMLTRAYDGVVQTLVAAGCRGILPFLRGFAATQFLSPEVLRSGQQGAIGNDVLQPMNALGLQTAMLVGFYWGAASDAWCWPCGLSA